MAANRLAPFSFPLEACRKAACFFALSLLLTAGCKKEADVAGGVSELEKAFPAAISSAAPAANPANPTPVPVANADPNSIVQAALTAVRANDYAGSVIALQAVQRSPKVNQQQLMAVEKAKQAITADLQARAARGDAKALADLAAIEKTLSQ